MAENIQTGGLMTFRHSGNVARASKEEKKEIAEAYDRYYERKDREKRTRVIWWVVGLLILICLIGAYVYFKG